MISAGLVATQKSERRNLGASRNRNGITYLADHLRLIKALALTSDTRPSEDLGQKPELMWLPKTMLHVDERYQREAQSRRSRQLIKRIVENLSWSKFQPVTVAEVAEGSLAGHFSVIDGQHRVIAALAHPSVVDLPCWVVNAANLATQANVFVSVNRDRANIQAIQLYRAQLAAGEPAACRVDAVCRAAGVSIAFPAAESGHSARTLPACQTQAVVTIGRLLIRYGDGPVTAALRTLVAAYPDLPGQLRGQVIEAVVSMIVQYGKKLDEERLARVLADYDCESLLDDARKVKNLFGGKTSKGMEAALTKAYQNEPRRRRQIAVAAE